MKEVELEKWSDFDSQIDSLAGNWIFRGQSNSVWEINSSIYRFFSDIEAITKKKNSNYREVIETNIIEEFASNAHLFMDILPSQDNPLEWLSVMQHYGCPTRLLDVTCSPYVATFFALDSGVSDAAIYAINADHFSNINGEEILSNEDVSAFLKKGKNDASQLAIYSPRWRSERIVIQQGLFIVPNTLVKSIDDILDDYCLSDDQAVNSSDNTFNSHNADKIIYYLKLY